jgi:hypothetical protein
MQGNFVDAKRMADELADNVAPIAKEMTMVESAVATPVLVLVRFGRWTEVIKVPLHEGAGPLARSFWHFARGVAFARLGNILGAQSEQKDFEAARTQVPDDVAMFQNSQQRLTEIASHVLTGRILEASGERTRAIPEYETAIAMQDALNYDEPADWFYPVRKTLGATLLRAGRASDAANVFGADLAMNPHNPRSLWGVATARKSGTSAYRRRWKGAPLKLEDF